MDGATRLGPVLVPPHVLEAFGCTGVPQPLAGGTGSSVLVDDAVLKPGGDGTGWLAALQERLRPDGIRTPTPRRADDGQLVVEGWTATAYLPGAEQPGRWAETVATGRALHAALADFHRPPQLAARTDRWARADRVAWAEATADLGDLGAELTGRYADAPPPAQLVHCDLSGNVLFHPTLPPAVIDLSLYWRPPAYVEAVVAVDAMLWYDAEPDVLDLVQHPRATELLRRAAVFRLACELSPEHLGSRTAPTAWRRLADLLAVG